MRSRAFILVISGLALFLASGCSREAFYLLRDIEAGPGPSRLKETRPAPKRRAFHYRHDGTAQPADVYVPGPETPGEPSAPRAALVLVPGAAPAGKDDPRLIAFAESFARAGFMVFIPDIGEMRSLRLSAGDVGSVRAAITAVAERCMNGAAGSLGLLALSYAAGPALLAALAPDEERIVRFLVAVGPYYDITAAITYFTTGAFQGRDGHWQYREPNPYSKWAFARANAGWLDDRNDRARIEAMADRRLDDPATSVSDLAEGLGPEGRAVYLLLTNTDPDHAPDLIAALPTDLQREIAALDLKDVELGDRAPAMILVHGRDDVMIPFTESRALADALRAAGGRPHLYVLDHLAHVDLERGGWWSRLQDGFKMWRALDRILGHRDRMPAPGPCLE